MAQLFSRRFGFTLRLSILLIVGICIAGLYLWRMRTAYPAGIGEALEQPVPFSHKHHVGDVGIDCRYCHASVETSAFAGIPPISTCMTCHSQLYTSQAALAPIVRAFQTGIPIRWERLHKLPDFVYFNHSIHVRQGVGCSTCHGAVERMPLTARVASLEMKWCLDCHRHPEAHVRPREQVFNQEWRARDQGALGAQLVRDYGIDTRRLADCSVCHR